MAFLWQYFATIVVRFMNHVLKYRVRSFQVIDYRLRIDVMWCNPSLPSSLR